MATASLSVLRQKIADVDILLLRAFLHRFTFRQNLHIPFPHISVAAAASLVPAGLAQILAEFCEPGRDEDSCAVQKANEDIIRALDIRLNLGREVADAKQGSMPEDYNLLIASMQRETVLALLTDLPTELTVIDRIKQYAHIMKAPEQVPAIWVHYIIPWMKEAEVARLFEPL